jgi:hypothetical protein
MKRKDLYNSFHALEVVKDLKGVKFAYALLKNKKKIEEEIKIFEEIIKPNAKFEEYEIERIRLCEFHSEKNEDGTPVIISNRYKLVDDNIFNKELELLKLDYNEFIDERMMQLNEYNKMLEEDINIEIIKIKFDDIPSNISAKELEDIDFMVDIY